MPAAAAERGRHLLRDRRRLGVPHRGCLGGALLRLELGNLGADGVVEAMLRGELRIDRVLRGRALGNEATGGASRVVQELPVAGDRALVRRDLLDERRVLVRDRVLGLEAVDEVIEALRAEDHGEGRLAVLRRVDRDEPLGERLLRGSEVAARDAERLLVDREFLLEELQLRGGLLIAAARDLRSRVELLELPENALRLGLLRRHRPRARGCGSRRRNCDAEQSNEQRRNRNLPLQRADDVLRTVTSRGDFNSANGRLSG